MFLEVAEDYAVATADALIGTQIKDDAASGRLTLHSQGVRTTIDAICDLTDRNPGRLVRLNYLTTADMGSERQAVPGLGMPALRYWRRAAAGGDVAALRTAILSLGLAETTIDWLRSLNDEEFRTSFLARIHWHCGSPSIEEVRSDLEAGLIEFVATSRRLSSQTGRDLVPDVVEHVLAVATQANARKLRRADLLDLVDRKTTVTIPISELRFDSTSHSTPTFRSSHLVSVMELPLPAPLAARQDIVELGRRRLEAGGVAMFTGATGMGKSLIARLTASSVGGPWSLVDLRDLTSREAEGHLQRVLGELSASAAQDIILDDLNQLDVAAIRGSFERILSSQRRRDRRVIVTAYRSPPIGTIMGGFGLDSECVLPVPYFVTEEIAALVEAAGGPSRYADHIRRVAGGGHPQLTMATILYLSRSGWSRTALASVLGGALPDEIGIERRAARQQLVESTDQTERALLMRTSVIRGSFDRGTALALADLVPTIPTAGFALDRLIGPWIEPTRDSRLRLSPLLFGTAEEAFSEVELRAIHDHLAHRLLDSPRPSVLDVGAMLHHSLGSRSPENVTAFAMSVLGANLDTIDVLASFAGELAELPTDAPVFEEDRPAELYLRAAQLVVAVSREDREAAINCLSFISKVPDTDGGRPRFWIMLLSKILLTGKGGAVFSDWLDKLIYLDELIETEADLTLSWNEDRAAGRPDLIGVLFSAQVTNIRSVASFRRTVEQLDNSPASFRNKALSGFETGRADLALLVNHAWLRESRKEGFDWQAAARDYLVCSEIAAGWANPTLAIRCAIAAAVCFDEDGNDRPRAAQTLAEAETRFGLDVAILRAKAKLHWRHREHEAALPLLDQSAAIGGQDPVEQSFIAREAGISAAELGRWSEAAQWFLRAQTASGETEVPQIRAMSIGLCADAALATFKGGNAAAALLLMRDAVVGLRGLDADGTTAEAYCHRVVRHAVAWLFTELKEAGAASSLGLHFVPGMCSNPDPTEEVRKLPLGHIDVIFYLLAQADLHLPNPERFHAQLGDFIEGLPIIDQEIMLTMSLARLAIDTGDAEGFVDLVGKVSAVSAALAAGATPDDDMVNPVRGPSPKASLDDLADPDLLTRASDFVLSFGIAAALSGKAGTIDDVVNQTVDEPHLAGLRALFRQIAGGDTERVSSDMEGAARAIGAIGRGSIDSPRELWAVSSWIVLHLGWSEHRSVIEGKVVSWVRERIAELVSTKRFLLKNPSLTCPAVEAVLNEHPSSRGSTARVLLVAAPACGVAVHPEVRARLLQIVEADGPTEAST